MAAQFQLARCGYAKSMDSTPSDNTTLVQVIEGYRKTGFDSDFAALEGGIIRCDSCATEIDAAKFVIESLRRMEGASDPDDMLAVIATHCPNCNAHGTLVLGYGPMAAGEDIDVSAAMQDGRDATAHDPGPLPPDASPADEANA